MTPRPRLNRRKSPVFSASARVAAALIFVCLCAPVAPAIAAEQIVTLIDLSSDAAAAKEISHDIARALRRSPNLRYVSVNNSLNVGAEDVHRTNLRSGKGLLRSALTRMRDGDYDEASEELESAVTNYSQSFAFTIDHDAIEEAMVMHGVALMKTRQRKPARTAWIRAVEFRPKHKADLSAYGPKIQKAYDDVREKVLLREQVTFEVQTKPAHAEVWCNGRYFGLSPAYVRSFSGRQFIAIRKHGYARMGKVQTVKKADGEQVAFDLAEARKAPVYNKLRESLVEVFGGAVERNDLSAARGLLNAGTAVILKVSGTRHKVRIQLALANLNGRQVVKRMTKEMPWLRRDKKAMEALVKELFKAPEIPKGSDGPIIKNETVLTKWWFWAGAAAVVGGSITAYVLLSGDETLDARYKPGFGGLSVQF